MSSRTILCTMTMLLTVTYNSLMVKSTDSLSDNENSCGMDEYKHNDWCCKKCDLGTHLKEDCVKGGTRTCVPCESGEYMDEMNHLLSCHRCTVCDGFDGKEIQTSCSTIRDAECKCKEKHFLTSEKHCLTCRSCKETEEIAQECSPTNNTVCREKAKNNNSTGIVLGVLFGIVALVVFGGVVYLYKKQYFKKWKTSKPEETLLFKTKEVPDIDLTSEQLLDISELIEPRHYHKIGLKLGLTEATLQQIASDCRNNSKEEGYRILLQWFEIHGKRKAFPDLIDKLREAEFKNVAENIIQKIVGDRAEVSEGCVSNPEDCENGKLT